MTPVILLGFLACPLSGSVVLPETETGEYPDLTARIWNGHREFEFEGQCEFSVYEEGERITDTTNPVYQIVTNDCSDCQVYSLNTSPEFTDCGELGTIGTGGQRYRAVRYTDFGLDLWYIYPPVSIQSTDWIIDFMSTAQGDDSSWGYTIQDNFQAFVYTSIGQFSLDPEDDVITQ